MESIDKKEGNWLNIPYEILLNPELDNTEKILLAEIQSLHKLEKGCFASNDHFALLLGFKTASAASRRITGLAEMGYLTTKNVYGKGNCIWRVITPTFKKVASKTMASDTGDNKSSSGRIKEVVPERQGGDSDSTRGVVPDEQGVGSDMTRGVVLDEQGGSSVGNTINTIINTDILKQDTSTVKLIQATSTDSGIGDNRLAFALSELEDLEDINPVLTLQEYRAMMDQMFVEEEKWRNDLLECGMRVFIKITKHCHLDNKANIFNIKCYFKLLLEKHINSIQEKRLAS